MTFSPTIEDGKKFAQEARSQGFSVTGNGGVIKLHATFTPHDNAAFCGLENCAMSLLIDAPSVTPGSIWGSTSDGVGGAAALHSGKFTLCASGLSKRFVKGAVSDTGR